MSSLLPWPDEYMLARDWQGVGGLLARCLALHRERALPSTLLLLGEEGLGRETLAIDLAAGLVCRDSGGVRCECSSCNRVRRGIHPDVEIVRVEEGSQEIKIQQARELVLRLPQVPYEGQRRVVVIASAHTPPLNVHAASALLKALEEPPSHVTIILLAANFTRVLPTVVSRSVMVRIPPPSDIELTRYVSALHGIDEATATEFIAAIGGDLQLLSHPAGLAVKDLVPDLRARLLSALAGNSLGFITGVSLIRQLAGGHQVAARALLRDVCDVAPEHREIVLAAAAGLLAASYRSEVLKLDGDATASAALAPLIVESMGP